MEENRDKVGFQLTTILPTCVFGPQRFDEDVLNGLNFSNQIFESIVHSFPEEELTPDLYPEFVDVRDVAKAHLLAFQNKDAINQRLVLNSAKYKSQEIADILNSKFPQLKGKITEELAPGMGHKNPQSHFNTTKTNNILGIKYRTLGRTVIDTAAQVLKGEGWL